MSTLTFDAIKVGDTLPPLTLAPINRTTLALFAGASGDHNAVHIDTDFARRAGMPDVFGVRFVGITHLGHQITCNGRVVEKFEVDGEQRARLEIHTSNQYGEPRVLGDAVIAF
jgi:acyl dehydratase